MAASSGSGAHFIDPGRERAELVSQEGEFDQSGSRDRAGCDSDNPPSSTGQKYTFSSICAVVCRVNSSSTFATPIEVP